MKKGVFLDRDGVINKIIIHSNLKDKIGKTCKDPLNLEEFIILPKVKEAINNFKKNKYELIIVSNQPGLVKGFYKKEVLDEITKFIKESLRIKYIYYCLDHPLYNGDCDCRKPKPGLLLKAARELKINLNQSILIGDQETDIEAGIKAGCKTILISKTKNKRADFTAKNLLEASKIICP